MLLQLPGDPVQFLSLPSGTADESQSFLNPDQSQHGNRRISHTSSTAWLCLAAVQGAEITSVEIQNNDDVYMERLCRHTKNLAKRVKRTKFNKASDLHVIQA